MEYPRTPDFFDCLTAKDSYLIRLLKALQDHPCRGAEYGLEEIYAFMVMVCKDMYLGEKELALWWVIVEEYGFDPQYELLRTLYYSAYAAKETLGYVGVLDKVYVESNFVDHFVIMYPYWSFDKIFDKALRKTTVQHLRDVPHFLKKDVDYHLMLETMQTMEDSQGLFDALDGGYNTVVKDLVTECCPRRKAKDYEGKVDYFVSQIKENTYRK